MSGISEGHMQRLAPPHLAGDHSLQDIVWLAQSTITDNDLR